VKLQAGQVAVVTGAASGIGFALAERFARERLDVVLADVDEAALARAADAIGALGVRTLAVLTDVSDDAAVGALAAAAVEHFGAVHVLCNNAGVSSSADPWFGPLSAWRWVVGVNLWGVVHGVQAFLPTLIGQSEGHIVNTASIAGLMPGAGPMYTGTKHAVVALTQELYTAMQVAGLPIGVSVLCPGWVRTRIADAERNWPQELGEKPPPSPAATTLAPHLRRAIEEGTPAGTVAEHVAEAIAANRFWIFPHPEWVELAMRRWERIAEGANPEMAEQSPGLPPRAQLIAELQAAMNAT
jgi:NAD(P)-dependent dehydrogenase (short-subunit alcohol dehydrogenase family)